MQFGNWFCLFFCVVVAKCFVVATRLLNGIQLVLSLSLFVVYYKKTKEMKILHTRKILIYLYQNLLMIYCLYRSKGVHQSNSGPWQSIMACLLVGAGAGLGWLVLVFLRGKHCWLVGLG